MQLLGNNCMILPDKVPLDNEMGEYASENKLIQQTLCPFTSFFFFLFLYACVIWWHCRIMRWVALLRFLCLPTFGSKRRACQLGGLAHARTLGESKPISFRPHTAFHFQGTSSILLCKLGLLLFLFTMPSSVAFSPCLVILTSLACAAIKAQCIFPPTGKSSVAKHKARQGWWDYLLCLSLW